MEMKTQEDHIASIYEEYTTPSRVLRSFTNLSNTVIQTALSGQSKFVFEILQNADDAFESGTEKIAVEFILHEDYLIVHHNGKGFDYNDVERICDYASQIEEVKATDLSKTGYKGLGFKSLFNLSDCIYIYSNGYSFRFDKSFWPDPETRPWQVIPIWCRYDELPLHTKYLYNQPVNFILKVNDVNHIKSQLRELVDQPELLLYLHRINKLIVNLNGEIYSLERKLEEFGKFYKVEFFKNQDLASTWLSKTYKLNIPAEVKKILQVGSRFIYPDKIKKAKKASFTFALRSDETLKEISKIRGLCYSTLPTQLHLTLPYHLNSIFILNLDRTQLHENEWNEFLIYQIGQLQLFLLRDLAEIPYLKNYVIQLFVRGIDHPYATFKKAFLKGFTEAKAEIGWLPAHYGSRLLKLGQVWTDDTEFFKQNFQNIRNHKIYPFLINYDVKSQKCLRTDEGEARHFSYFQLFKDFPEKYYPQLTKSSYISFISYLYEKLKNYSPNTQVMSMIKHASFLIAKDGTLVSPKNALLEENENPIPDFSMLNPVDNESLPLSNTSLIKDWLALLGARRLMSPIQVLRESVLKWVDSGYFKDIITEKNHMEIINYLGKNAELLTKKESEKLKDKILILTEGKSFKPATLCFFPEAVSVRELADVISKDEKISSSYDMDNLKGFFIHMGVHDSLKPVDVFRRSILKWIRCEQIHDKLKISNYNPIVEYFALNFPTIERNLQESEKSLLKNMLVLTCDKTFQKAEVCYFTSALPKIKGIEYVISRNKLVSDDVSSDVSKFFSKIGVSKKIASIDIIRKSVLKWIQEGDAAKRITVDNHVSILEYVAEQWLTLNRPSGLKPKEKKTLKRIPILTKGNTFRAACECFWPTSSIDGIQNEEIPGLEEIISSNEFVSLDYHSKIIKVLLDELGVRSLGFTVIYDKYSDHLTHPANVRWFFSRLENYWRKNNKASQTDNLLSDLQKKFNSSCRLLAKNGRVYVSKQLYSSRFRVMHDIDTYSVPLLDYEKLPEDLERWLSFKMDLDLKCIAQLLKAIQERPEVGNAIFFKTVLEQLRRKDRDEIKRCQFSLLSAENKLRPAKDLYYFIEKDATCVLYSCYLKRVYGMTHEETLDLADMCGVNTLPFEQKVEREKETQDNTLKEFYLERLPFIVLQESRELNESFNITLKRLYDNICSIKLYQCRKIYIKYPFGHSVEIRNYFDNLTVYVVGKWATWEHKSYIHKHIRHQLGFKTDILKITDMVPLTEDDKQAWLHYQNAEDKQKFYLIEGELQKLLSDQGKVHALTSDNINFDQIHLFSDKEAQHLDHELSRNKELTNSELSSEESSVGFVKHECKLNMKDLLTIEEFLTSDQAHLCENKETQHLNHELSGNKKFTTAESLSDEESSSDESSVGSVEHKPKLKSKGMIALDELLAYDPLHHLRDKEAQNLNWELSQNKELAAADAKSDAEKSSLAFVEHESNLKPKYTIALEELFSSDASSDEGSVAFIEDEPQYAIKAKSSGVSAILIDERRYGVSTGSVADIGEDAYNTLVPGKLDIDPKKRTLQSEAHGTHHSSNEGKTSRIQWLSEKYVFTFLQNRYKNKYPNSVFNLVDGRFTLHSQSHEIKIIWLNENEDKEHPYDLLLEKDGDTKWLIEVDSTNVEYNDTFHMSHRKFIEKTNQLAIKMPEHKEKYCVYRVFSAGNSSVTSVEELLSLTALYKVVPLKTYKFQ